MKNALILLALIFSVSSFAQERRAHVVTTEVVLSPFATTTNLLRASAATTMSPFLLTTLDQSIDARGVAGKDQMRDELVALDKDMSSGAVKKLEEVRQPALRELFSEISQNEEQMEEINSTVKVGSELHKIAVAVTLKLIAQ